MIRIGCSGWSYADWRGVFYPPSGSTARWLEIYAQSFDTVEINATFYRLPNVKTVQGWAARTPDDFLFAVKVSRYLTHVKRLRGIVEGIKRMDACVDPLRQASKLGPMLWQLPPHFQRNDDVLASALDALTPGRHAFEFRDPSWFAEDVYDLLSDHGAALVADRAPADASPMVETAPWRFLRFHYGRGREGTYTARELRAWADRLKPLRDDVFAYFNNDWQGFAIDNARTLHRLVTTATSCSTPSSSTAWPACR